MWLYNICRLSVCKAVFMEFHSVSRIFTIMLFTTIVLTVTIKHSEMNLFSVGAVAFFLHSKQSRPMLLNKAFKSKIQCCSSCCHRFIIYSYCSCIPLKHSNFKVFMLGGVLPCFIKNSKYASSYGSGTQLHTTPFPYPRKILATYSVILFQFPKLSY